MTPPPRTPAECFATLIRCLSAAVAAMGGGNRLTFLLIGQITDRLREINQRFARIAALVREGRYAPRRFSPRRPPALRRPRPPSPLPRKFGWLFPLLPEAVQYRAQLEHLLRDPGMAALLAAAPASLGRPLRSLCWMLRVSPPAILAPPPRPAPPVAPAAPETASPVPPPPQPPPRSRKAPRPRRWSLARICGPPYPA